MLNTLCLTASAALPNDSSIKLSISSGIPVCIDTSEIFPDCTDVTVREGSYSRLGSLDRLALEGDTEIILGITQAYSGPVSGSRSSQVRGNNIVKKDLYFLREGTNYTTRPVIADNNGGLDLSGWRLFIASASGATIPDPEILDLGAGGKAAFVCTALDGTTHLPGDCQVGDAYTLDYTTISIASVATSGFNNQTYVLHLEGFITPRGNGPFFENVTALSGIDFQNGGHGIAWIDFDNDSYPDLFVPGSSRLFHNIDDPSSDNPVDRIFADVSAQSPDLTLVKGSDAGATTGDYNGDGFDDILIVQGLGSVSGSAPLPNLLFKNTPDGAGGRMFIDVTLGGPGLPLSGLQTEQKHSETAAFGDLNGDGWLDIYIANNTFNSAQGSGCSDSTPNINVENDLYLNNEDGTFTRRDDLGANDFGCAFATAMSDYDTDGDLDIFVINDVFANTLINPGTGTPDVLGSEIYRNNLNETGVANFTPVGWGVRVEGMGIAIGDYNNDGKLDYFQTAVGPGALSTNKNNSLNPFITTPLGSFMQDGTPSGAWGLGAVFFDVDNDRMPDLYRVNGLGLASPNELLLNQGDGTFNSLRGGSGLAQTGLNSVDNTFGVAVADYNRDGRVDIVTQASDGKVVLSKNISRTPNQWLAFDLKGRSPNHRGIGAKIRLKSSPSGTSQMREVHAGSSEGSTHEFIQHFGLGTDIAISEAMVIWPNSCEQIVNNIAINQLQVVSESACISTVSGFDFPYGLRTMQIDGTNLRKVTITVAGIAVPSEDISYIDDNGQVTGEVVFALMPEGVSGQVVLSSPYTSGIVVGNYTAPPPAVLAIDAWVSATAGSSVLNVKGSNFLTVTDIKINGVSTFIYNVNSKRSIDVLGFNAANVNRVSITTLEEGTVTLNAQPVISGVVAATPITAWSTVSGSGFKFGIVAAFVNGASVGVQLNADGTLLVTSSVNSINTTKLEVVTTRGSACFGPDCP
ncbi:MAG TPA: CRTAC1 family protein [Gammaproteobacteria bacterium]|nr:CRTAC1 family protein [Gammaproteobacteria bacterium]